jgi:PPOX class probable F420-dependent enzyme
MDKELWGKAKVLIEGKNFGNFATLMPDGSPHVAPVWVDHEGDLILVNTAEGRTKLKNVTRDPRVALSIFDQGDPYNKVVVRGRVVEITKKGAEEHIDKMAMKYRGLTKYPWRQPGVSRVLVKIKPMHISS